MRIACFYCAYTMPLRYTRVVSVLVLIIIMIVCAASRVGNGRAVLVMVSTATLTAIAEELVRRAAASPWPRVT